MSETVTVVLIVSSVMAVVVGGTIYLVLAMDRASRRQKVELRNAICDLGLVEDPSAAAHGWRSLARGTWQGVALAIGEREYAYMTTEGPRRSICLEVASVASSDLGRYRIPHRFLSAPHVVPVVRSGDSAFDNHFVIVPQGADGQQHAPSPFNPTMVLAQTRWLDDITRRLLLASRELQELVVHDKEISVILRWYERETFRNAVELALYLARWPGGTGQAYR